MLISVGVHRSFRLLDFFCVSCCIHQIIGMPRQKVNNDFTFFHTLYTLTNFDSLRCTFCPISFDIFLTYQKSCIIAEFVLKFYLNCYVLANVYNVVSLYDRKQGEFPFFSSRGETCPEFQTGIMRGRKNFLCSRDSAHDTALFDITLFIEGI